MPKAKNKRIRHEEDSGQKQQQLATDLENHGDQEESCGALETTKYSILEKIASFFEDRPFFYDIQNDHGFTHIVRLLCWWCCLWSSKRIAAIRKSRLMLTCNNCSLRFASFTPWACINGIFVSIVFFATYDDSKGRRLYILEETDCGRRTGTSGCPNGARTMPVRLYVSHGLREATVRTSWGARTVIVEIARTSCDFSGGKNITKS